MKAVGRMGAETVGHPVRLVAGPELEAFVCFVSIWLKRATIWFILSSIPSKRAATPEEGGPLGGRTLTGGRPLTGGVVLTGRRGGSGPLVGKPPDDML